MISDVHGKNTFIISANMLYYHYYDHICERDGRLIYYVVGSHEEKEFPARFKEPVLKSIEYLEKEKSYRLDITSDTAPAQIKKKLKRCQAKVGSENIKSIMINIIYLGITPASISYRLQAIEYYNHKQQNTKKFLSTPSSPQTQTHSS